MKKILKKSLSLFLCLSMLVGIVPFAASAETLPEEEPTTYTIDLGQLPEHWVLKSGSLLQTVNAGEPIETVTFIPEGGYQIASMGIFGGEEFARFVADVTERFESVGITVSLFSTQPDNCTCFDSGAFKIEGTPTGNMDMTGTYWKSRYFESGDIAWPSPKRSGVTVDVYVVPPVGGTIKEYFGEPVYGVYDNQRGITVYPWPLSGPEKRSDFQSVLVHDEMKAVTMIPEEGWEFVDDEDTRHALEEFNNTFGPDGFKAEFVDGTIVVSSSYLESSWVAVERTEGSVVYARKTHILDDLPAAKRIAAEEPSEEEDKPSGGFDTDKPSVKPNPGHIIVDDETAADKPEGSDVVVNLLNTYDHFDYLHGYPNGTFAAGKSMTRAEAAQMFYNLLIDRNVETTVEFTDVPENAWYTKAVNTLASLGIIEGVGNGKFQPQRTINRAEFAAMIVRFSENQTSVVNIFSDVKDTAWYYEPVMTALSYGWIGGYHDGTFRPRNDVTRAEVATIVNRMLCRNADRSYITTHLHVINEFSDLSETHWAYHQIIEASTSHDFLNSNGVEKWTSIR